MTNEAFNPSPGVRRRLVPPLAAVTVLAVLLGGGYAFRHASNDAPGSGDPAVLRLADYQEPMADTPADNNFRLAGDLPAGPADAAVRWLTAPERSDVERLAKALGIRGHRTSASGVTTYTTQAGALRVQQDPGGSWQYVRSMGLDGIGCPPYPADGAAVGDPSTTVSCDVAVPLPIGVDPRADSGADSGDDRIGGIASEPPVTSPTDDGAAKKLASTTPEAARAAARPVLEAVGIDPADAIVRADQPQGVVVADPTVADLPTYGLATSLTVFGAQVAAAGGWLGGSQAGATYPVISATAAWKQLTRTPTARPLIGCPELLPAGRDPLICGGPITVTGARFGLSLHEENGRRLLVPSWLFDVRDSDSPLSVIAIDPRYLAAAPAATMGGGEPGSSGSGTGGSSGSGTGGTVVPPVAPSADPGSPNPGTPESRFSSVHADDSGNQLVVAFTGGVRACFSYTVVPTETNDQVALTLVEKTSSNKRCIEMAEVYERRVPLAKPLGTRQVVDAHTGAVLLARSR